MLGYGLPVRSEVEDHPDTPLVEGVEQVAGHDVVLARVRWQAGIRDGDGQVERGLRCRLAERLRSEAVVDEQVGPDAEQDGGQRDERHERDGQPRPDPAHRGDLPQRAAL